MLGIIRKIPHPNYGNYGGAYNKCDKDECPFPIDWLDEAFMWHDINLKEKPKLADSILAEDLREGNIKDVKGWYGKTYLFVCKIIFRK